MRRGLQEAGEVGALAQFGDAQFDRAGARLPDPVAVAVALCQTLRLLLAIGRPGLAFDFQFHQPLGGKADHLTQQIGVRGLLYERAQVHHIVGHRWLLGCVGVSQPDPTGELPVTTAKPPARYGAIGGARPGGFALPSYTTIGDTTRSGKSRCPHQRPASSSTLARPLVICLSDLLDLPSAL